MARQAAGGRTHTPRARLNVTNAILLPAGHLLAALAVVHLCFRFSWWTVGFATTWFLFCMLSISGGYHRLFAHPTHRAAWPLRLFYLMFGAASIQHSALKWSADHREHHAYTDREYDPYNASRGFWWSHIGWVFFDVPGRPDFSIVRDLARDPLVRFQDRFYVPITICFCVVLPAAFGLLWGDPLGALLCAGFLRLVIQWHITFSINSFAHMLGTQPYSRATSARDSWVSALLTLGEGYHNYHHRFQNDFRNGVGWYKFDPTKWFVWLMSKVGLATDLKRMSWRAIERARRECGGKRS